MKFQFIGIISACFFASSCTQNTASAVKSDRSELPRKLIALDKPTGFGLLHEQFGSLCALNEPAIADCAAQVYKVEGMGHTDTVKSLVGDMFRQQFGQSLPLTNFLVSEGGLGHLSPVIRIADLSLENEDVSDLVDQIAERISNDFDDLDIKHKLFGVSFKYDNDLNDCAAFVAWDATNMEFISILSCEAN